MGERKTGTFDGDRIEIMTVDRHSQNLVYLIRDAYQSKPDSHLVEWGKVANIEELRLLQLDRKIKDKAIFGDDGGPIGSVSEWRFACMRYGWNSCKAEDRPHYLIGAVLNSHGDIIEQAHLRGWRETACDPGIGTTEEGLNPKMPLWLWSKPWYQERLYKVFVAAIYGKTWFIPKDIDAQYLKEMSVTEYKEEHDLRGKVKGQWYVYSKLDHASCCEEMQCAARDICGIRSFAKKG
jgi:hypothetical protein